MEDTPSFFASGCVENRITCTYFLIAFKGWYRHVQSNSKSDGC